MSRLLIDPGFVEDALAGLRCAGQPVAPVLAAAGLDEAGARAPVTPERYGALWRAVAEAGGDEFFGLGARPMRPGSFALMCQAALHAPDLGRALDRMLRFLTVVLDDPRARLVRDGTEAAIVLQSASARPAFCHRSYALLVIGPASWMIGRRIALRRVDFACPAPEGRRGYASFFGVPVRFDQPVTRFGFAASLLSRPTLRDEAGLRRFLARAPANLLTRMEPDGGAAAATRALLRGLPAAQWPDFEAVAAQFGLSPATLRRRLRAEGQSFAAIRDELRHARADAALAAGARVAEIAAELGYSEPGAFHRAYRKWTDRTPGAIARAARADRS